MKSLVEAEEELAANIDSHSSMLLSLDSHAVASYIIRGINGRSDLAYAINLTTPITNSFFSKLEQVRTLIALGDIEQSWDLLKILEPNNEVEEIEVKLELCRLNIVIEEYEEVLKIAHSTVEMEGVSPVTKLTLYQLMGHAYMALSDFAMAKRYLLKAISISVLYPNVQASYSCQAFLCILYSKTGARQESLTQLTHLKQRLDSIDDKEVWPNRYLIYLRTKYFYLKYFDSEDITVRTLIEAKHLATWLNDIVTKNKCENDLKQFQEANALEQGKFLCVFDAWTYLPEHDLLLSYVPKRFSIIKNFPITKKVIALLSKGPISQEVFFKKIWGLEFARDIHGVHVRSNLSKSRHNPLTMSVVSVMALPVISG